MLAVLQPYTDKDSVCSGFWRGLAWQLMYWGCSYLIQHPQIAERSQQYYLHVSYQAFAFSKSYSQKDAWHSRVWTDLACHFNIPSARSLDSRPKPRVGSFEILHANTFLSQKVLRRLCVAPNIGSVPVTQYPHRAFHLIYWACPLLIQLPKNATELNLCYW